MSGLLYQPTSKIEAKGGVVTVKRDINGDFVDGELLGGWICSKEYGGSSSSDRKYGIRLRGILCPWEYEIEHFKAVFVVGAGYENLWDRTNPPSGSDEPMPLNFNVLLATDTELDENNSSVYIYRETAYPGDPEYPTYEEYGTQAYISLKEHNDNYYLYTISPDGSSLYPYAGPSSFWGGYYIMDRDTYSESEPTISDVKWLDHIIAIKMFKYSKEASPSLQNSVNWYANEQNNYDAGVDSVFWEGYIWEELVNSTSGSNTSSSSYGSSSYGSSSYGPSSYGSSSYGGGYGYGGDYGYGGGDSGYGYTGEFVLYFIPNQNTIYNFIEVAFIDYSESVKVKVNKNSFEIWETDLVNNFKLGHYSQEDVPTIDAFNNPPEVPAEVVAIFKDVTDEDRWSLLHSHQLLFKGRDYSSKFSPQTIKIIHNSDNDENILIQQDVMRIKNGNNNIAIRPTGIKKNGNDLIQCGVEDIGAGSNLETGCIYLVYEN